MMKCPYCGLEDAGTDVCSACGRLLPPEPGADPGAVPAAMAGLAILQPGTLLRGRYRISSEKWPDGRHCCEGGQGVVYYAIDRHAEDRPCVVKQSRELVTSDAVLVRLRQEARQMAELSRAIGGRMAEIVEDFVEDGRFYLVEQRIFGETLQNVFEKRGQLAEREVVDWTIQCCNILQRVHDHSTLHRDISPDNLMLTPVGDIMFIDFGTLREFQRIMQGTRGMGKYGFTPPEQWAGNPSVESDIFSLGATAYYLLTGFLPVSKEYKAGRGFQAGDLRPRFPPIRTVNRTVSQGLERILSRALDLDVGRRYPSAEAMKKDLELLVRPAPPRSPRPAGPRWWTAPQRSQEQPRREQRPVEQPRPDEQRRPEPERRQPEPPPEPERREVEPPQPEPPQPEPPQPEPRPAEPPESVPPGPEQPRPRRLLRPRWVVAGVVLVVLAVAILVVALVSRGDGLLPPRFRADFELAPGQYGEYAFKVDATGTINVDVAWSGDASRFSLVLIGPDGAEHARRDGGGPLSVSHEVTPADVHRGERWLVYLSNVSLDEGAAAGALVVS